MNLKKYFIAGLSFLSALFISLTLISCGGKSKNPKAIVPATPLEAPKPDEKDITKFFKCYYFSKEGFSFCEKPSDAPDVLFRPWTESIRVNDANSTSSDDALLLVNKLGLLCFPKDKQFFLMQDLNIFENSTAENLIFAENEPFFTLYRNSFFAKNSSKPVLDDNRPYIIRASISNNAFYPAITYRDLEVVDGEITGTFFDGDTWLSSIKTSSSDSTTFRYIFWTPASSLLSMQPYYQEGKISIKETSSTTYRDRLEILPFAKSPERLKNLVGKLPAELDFTVKLKNSGGVSPRTYVRGEDSVINSTAILNSSWICCIFEDGTVYFNGSLNNRELANKGKNFAFRLPPLGNGYVYTDFAISGGLLICGWEEKEFFRTGKSGFITADLEKILYD